MESMGRWMKQIRKIAGNRLTLLLVGLSAGGAALAAAAAGGVSGLYRYLDLGLAGCLAAVFLFLMWAVGLLKDFGNGFRLVFYPRKDVTRMELQKAAKAMEAARRISALEGLLGVTVYLVNGLYRMEEPSRILGPYLSLILLTVLYTGIFSLVALPVRVKLENMTVSFMEEAPEGEDGLEDAQTVYFRLRAMGLTDREAEVARLVCLGLANKEIGQTLYISDATVKKHMTHILEKTGCDSREALTELVRQGSA